jgi:hypothetical protein
VQHFLVANLPFHYVIRRVFFLFLLSLLPKSTCWSFLFLVFQFHFLFFLFLIFVSWSFYQSFICFQFSPSIVIYHILFYSTLFLFFWFLIFIMLIIKHWQKAVKIKE